MYSQGKVGICVECGSISRPKDYTPFTITIIKQFLKCYDVIDDDVRLSTRSQQIIRADTVVIRNSKDFKLVPGLRNFQTLSAGEVFGSQNSKKFVAKEGQYIIFPQPDAEIGAEAFTIGYKV
jgi:succinylglutamate desuccinylase